MQDLDLTSPRLDPHLGGQRPFGLSYWPLPEDDPGAELRRESIPLVRPDGALVPRLLCLPPAGTPWRWAQRSARAWSVRE